jgi:predicted DNA-binding protein (MmcQ/YjbR family)
MARAPFAAGHPRGRAFKAWRAYLLAKPGATERHPFDPSFPVYFVKGRMFALYAGEPGDESLNLKCWPDWSVELRAQHPAITPGYHMNKKHWNTLSLDASLPRSLVKKLIDHSYDLVSGKLKALAKAEARGVVRKAVRP